MAVYNHYKRIIHDRMRHRGQDTTAERACTTGTPVVQAGLHPSTVEGVAPPPSKGPVGKGSTRGRAARDAAKSPKGPKAAEEEELVLDKSNILLLVGTQRRCLDGCGLS